MNISKKKTKNSEIIQLKNIYQSTTDFENFLRKNKVLNLERKNKIVDVGTGIGANLHYFSSIYKKSEFLGIDYQKGAIHFAKKINKNSQIKFEIGDMLKKNTFNKKNIVLVMTIHTICCFKDLNKPIKFICDFKPKWIAINSLFYDGPINVFIHMIDLKKKKIENDHPNSDFNIFSLQTLSKILKQNGYKIKKIKKHYPKEKIVRKFKERGSYTISTELDKNTIFSGPVHLPWHFVLAKRIII